RPSGPRTSWRQRSVRRSAGVVRGLDVRRDTSTVVHRVTVRTRPLADGGALPAAAAGAGTGTASGGAATADPASVPDPLAERVAQLGSILAREVDLVGDAVQGERHGLVGRSPVDI